MDTHDKLVHQLEGHAVEMGCGKQRKDFHLGAQIGQHLLGKSHVAPQGTLRNHHALGLAGRARCVIDHEQVVGLLLVEMQVSRLQSFGIGSLEQVFDSILFVEQTNLHTRQFLLKVEGLEVLGHLRTHEEHLCIAVLDETQHHFGCELVEQRHSHRTIGEGSEQAYAPLGAVSATKDNTKTGLQTGILPCQMVTSNTIGNFMIIKIFTLIIGERLQIPM